VNDAPLLSTERLELWRPRSSDEAAMFAIVSDPRTGRYLGPASDRSVHFTRFQHHAGSWFLHGYGVFLVRLKGRPEVIGNCGVFHSYRGLGEDFDDRPEAGWILSADHVGQGLAGEAMRAALAWFDTEHGPRPVVCMIAPENAASIALAEKLGFVATREAALRDGDAVRLFERRTPV